MIALAIIATIIDFLAWCGSIIKALNDIDNSNYESSAIVGSFIGACLRTLPIIAIWVLYSMI